MRTQRAGWRILGFVLFCSALTLLAPTHLFAQVDTGGVLGTVKDQSGAVVPGAIFLRDGANYGLLDRVIVNARIDAVSRDLRGQLIHA